MHVLALQAVDVGRVLSARVRSTGTGPGPAWHLDSITVTHCGSGQVAVFHHRGWLDAVHGWEVVLQEGGVAGAGGSPMRRQWGDMQHCLAMSHCLMHRTAADIWLILA